jgi:large subunit ribosomal protein L35
MPKMKTKSSTKRRFKVTATGKVIMSAAFRRHMMSNKSRKMKRQSKGTEVMFKTDGEKVRQYWMPYKR